MTYVCYRLHPGLLSTEKCPCGFDCVARYEEGSPSTSSAIDWLALRAAITACQKKKGVLLVSCPQGNLDNHYFLALLREANVPVVILDSPVLSKDGFDALIWFIKKRRSYNSERTRIGLSHAKKKGVALGNPANLSNQLKGSQLGVAQRRQRANDRAADLGPLIEELLNQGMSYRGIALEFVRRDIPTEREGRWTATQIVRVLRRLKSLGSSANI